MPHKQNPRSAERGFSIQQNRLLGTFIYFKIICGLR